MKSFKLLIMLLFTSNSLITSCEAGESYDKKEIKPVLIKEIANASAYTVTVKARNWQTINNVERLVDISIPFITDDIIKNGVILVFLIQGNKQMALPFNYYQVRSILSFQSSYKAGHAYINIFGNFLMNINEYYDFNIVVIAPDLLNKYNCIKWNDYNEIKKVFKIRD